MYRLQYVNEDRNKYLGTWIGVRGVLVQTDHFEHLGAGQYTITGVALDADHEKGYKGTEVHLRVRDGDIVWAPPLPTGYYNLDDKPWSGVWLTQTGAKQYKVGLNGAVLSEHHKIRLAAAREGEKAAIPGMGCGFITAALAFRDGFRSQRVERALSMMKKRIKHGALVGITKNLALERVGPIIAVVYRCTQVVGLVHNGNLHIDETFKHPDLNDLEYRYDSIKNLGALYRDAATA